jgi:hypothetical protein
VCSRRQQRARGNRRRNDGVLFRRQLISVADARLLAQRLQHVGERGGGG